jgi:phosphatidylethanolamine/phosphatidyl-N-methylethanolamine N-methyltransferase
MTLFERRDSRVGDDDMTSSDAATRTLSVTSVENDFVEAVYGNLASVYDWTFGPTLHPGRLQAIQRMGIRPGDHILEGGVGTGINAALYPRACAVTGVDLSASMLGKARKRIARKGISNVQLVEMDAADLRFDDATFDIVYAAYLISVVPDPVRVASEMCHVCRPGGKVIILNHFRSTNLLGSWCDRLISPVTIHVGFRADLDLQAFLAQAGLSPVSIEKVNVPRIWSLVTCVKA